MIWCISKYALPIKYGAQSRLFHISEELNKLGLESIVLTSSTNHLADLDSQNEAYKLKSYGATDAIFLRGISFKNSLSKNRVLSWFYFEWMLFKFISKGYKQLTSSPKVVYISSLSLLTILNGYYAKRKFGSKLVFEIRDIWPLSAVVIAGYKSWNPFVLFLRWVEKFGYRKSDYIVSPLANLKQHVKESIGTDDFKFRFFPQGYDISLLSESQKLPEEFISKYFPKDKFVFGYIGNIVSAYDLDSLIECAKELDPTHKNIHFIILGDGSYKQQLIENSKGLSNITFVPRIPKAQISHFLSFCDVATNFLKPEPLFKYGVSPQKLVDYMFASKPVLMSYTGYKTIIDDVKNGLVVESANIPKLVDAMVKLSQLKKEELAEMGQRGRSHLINNLSWTKLVQENIDLFEE
jgi:glycosyltransferase involved in cell wall biosynthesis